MSLPTSSPGTKLDERGRAVEQLKVYLPDPVRRIDLYDFMMGEIEKVIESIRDIPIHELTINELTGYERYRERAIAYEEAVDQLLDLLVVGVFHSRTAEHDWLWVRCLDRLATREIKVSGIVLLQEMQQYPTLLALYAVGLGGAAADRIDSIAQVIGSVKMQSSLRSYRGATSVANVTALNDDAMKKSFPDLDRRKTPVSDHLLEVLQPRVYGLVPNNDKYEDIFDEVEYLLGLYYAAHEGKGWGRLGRAVWRCRDRNGFPGEMVTRHSQVLIEAGIFNSREHFEEAKQSYDRHMDSSPLRY